MSEDKLTKLTLMASVGNRATNRPDDVDRLKERLLELRYPGIVRFRSPERIGEHTGFLNIERMLDRQGFYWGTSWFADTLVRAGQHYREHYLKEHPYAAPIPVNDVSRYEGRSNYPHKSHDTGLAVDLALPLKDGRWGAVTYRDAQYDRNATEAIISAFASTGMVKKVLYNDETLVRLLTARFNQEPQLNPGGMSISSYIGHDNHLHLSIQPPNRGKPIATPIELSGPVSKNATANPADRKAVWQRLFDLGFPLAHPNEGEDIKALESLHYAIRLFQAAVRGLGSPDKIEYDNKTQKEKERTPIEGITGSIERDSMDLKWLNAENAPRWQKIPAGTIEVFDDGMQDLKGELENERNEKQAQFDDVVGAIRRFQAIINGLDEPKDDPKKTDGVIHPDRRTHRWLNAGNAPHWQELDLPPGYELTQAGEVYTSSWLAGVLSAAAGTGPSVKIEAVRATSCDLVLPTKADGSFDVDAAKATISRFTGVTNPAPVKVRCRQSLAEQLPGCVSDDSVPDLRIRVQVKPPAMVVQPIPADRLPVVHVESPNPQQPSLSLMPGPAAEAGELQEEFLALMLPNPQDAEDEERTGIQLPLRARPAPPIRNGAGSPGSPVNMKAGPDEALPYPAITLPTLPDLMFDLSSAPASRSLMAPAVAEAAFRVPEMRVNSASLTLSNGGKDAKLTFEIEADVPGLAFEVEADVPVRRRPWRWKYELAQPLDSLTGLWYGGQRIVGDTTERVDWAERCWLCAQFAVNLPLADLGLPLNLGSQAVPITVRIGVSTENHLDIELIGEIPEQFSIDLGSPLARLDLKARGTRFSLSTFRGFSVTLPDQVTATLHLDLFDRFGDKPGGPVVNNIWSSEGVEPWLLNLSCEEADLSQLSTAAIPSDRESQARSAEMEADDSDEAEGAAPHEVTWQGGSPALDPALLEALINAMAGALANSNWVNTGRQLLALSGELPVLGSQMKTTFAPPDPNVQKPPDPNAPKPIEFLKIDQTQWALVLKLGMAVAKGEGTTDPILKGQGYFRFLVDAGEFGLAHMQPGALRMARGEVILEAKTNCEAQFGALLALHIPQGACFRFSCDPKDPRLVWDVVASRKKTEAPITVCVPAKPTTDPAQDPAQQFTFDMERFDVHSAGIDLRGAVRTGQVTLAGAGLAGAVTAKGVERGRTSSQPGDGSRPHQVGEIELKNSRLVYGSLQASARLPYFDDAVGTLSLFLSQNEAKKLACAGTLDIAGLSEFHVDALFTTFQIDVLHLGTKFEDKKWQSTAAMSGRIRFQPPRGRSAGDTRELAALFEGITLEFEDLNPLAPKDEQWRLTCPPRRFTFADVLLVDLRGLDIQLQGNSVKDCKLLGDITIQKLPGIDSSLSFGGITLRPGTTPTFVIDRIAAQFTAPGGFSMAGELEFLENDEERGFAGGFSVKIEALPELSGLLKLSRVRAENGDMAPALALYVEREADIELLYGFYLRRLGIGIGIRQALRGLEPVKGGGPQAERRLQAFIDNPAGLPDPAQVSSWRPVKPADREDLSWMLVGAGLTTWGNLPFDKPHLLAGSFLLSIDQALRVVLGTNLWLFTSPNETRQAEFVQRPVARGAMELSVREGYLRARLVTIKNPKLGSEAPPMLAQVLSQVETSLRFEVDRHGFVLEVGWPWETRAEFSRGPFKGQLQSGFRFGVYRGVLSYGLNFGMTVVLEAEQSLGFGVRGARAEARLSVRGEAYFRASFVGAVDERYRAYLLGDVRLNALVRIRASASVRIKISRWIKIKISFSATVSVSIAAALTAAMDPELNIGFQGDAAVAISVCGYRLAGRVAFAYQPNVIEHVRGKLRRLLPESSDRAIPRALRGLESARSIEEPTWHYRMVRLNDETVRVLLFPEPGQVYPKPAETQPKDPPERFRIKLAEKVVFGASADGKPAFVGFVGHDKMRGDEQGQILSWSEDLDHPVYRIADDLETVREIAQAIKVLEAAEPNILQAVKDAGDGPFDDKKEAIKEAIQGAVDILAFGDALRERVEKEVTGTKSAAEREKSVQKVLNDFKAELTDIGKEPPTLRDLLVQLPSEGKSTAFPTSAEAIVDHRNNPEYARRLAQATTPAPQEPRDDDDNQPTLPPGMLLAELLRLLKDPQAAPGTENINRNRSPEEQYRVAPWMKLVLEFKVGPHTPKISELIDLGFDECFLGGAKAKLEPVLAENEVVEYDLIPGAPHQEPGQVNLTWDFRREDENEGFAPYVELEEFRVTRINQSRPNERPRVTGVQPAWVVQKDDDGEHFIRPPFQFVDDQLQDVREGDLLQYRVEAMALDRTLAACLVNVVRRIVLPLPAVGQSLALHVVPEKDTSQTIEFVIPNDPDATDPYQPDELRLRYRLVPADRFGSYGYDRRPGVRTRWVDGLPSRAGDETFPTVQFAESAAGQSLPWEETEPWDVKLNPEEMTTRLFDPDQRTFSPKTVGYRLRVPWFANNSRLPQGMAVEFYVGRQRIRERTEQSVLVRCRHAVVAGSIATDLLKRPDGTLDLGWGNTVDAFEEMRGPRQAAEILAREFVQLAVHYPVANDQEASAESKPEPRPEVIIRWRHDHWSDASDDAKADPFDPVVAYRIHWHDRYAPKLARAAQGDADGRSAVLVRAVPERLYRAFPETISVEKRPTTAELDKKGTLNKAGFTANWQPVAAPEGLVLQEQQKQEQQKEGDSGFELISGDEQISWEGPPVWLHARLLKFLRGLSSEDPKVRCRLVIHDALQDRLAAESPQTEEQKAAQQAALKAAITQLSSAMNENHDPYGWRTAEALGSSCECHFLDGSGVAIPAETIKQRLHEQGADGPVSVYFFLAADGQTLLDVVRVACRAEDAEIRTALAYRFIGWGVSPDNRQRVPKAWPTDVDIKDVGVILQRKPAQWNPTAPTDEKQNRLAIFEQRRGQPDEQDGKTGASPAAPPISLDLPVSREGVVEYRLQAPDQWAHRYVIAIEKVRRHDLLWQQLRPDLRSTATIIPMDSCKEVLVDRTRGLVAHNLIATPLAGSIQAIIFRHPAAFAATASAVNAVHGQYSGQSITLQRRVDRQDDQVGFYKAIDPIWWQNYKPYASEERAWPVPLQSRDFPPLPRDFQRALQEVTATETGIYGADRYVYPDLPGYYQYRVGVYSTAGRRASPWERSDWITPLYTTERQRPRAAPPTQVTFEGKMLTIELPLVHPAYHLWPELWSLWRGVDEVLELNGKEIRFGELPDLFLTYQLFLRTNDPDEPTPVFVPLLGLVGPMRRPEMPAPDGLLGFAHNIHAAGAILGPPIKVIRAAAGHLAFELVLDLKDSRCRPLLAALAAEQQTEKLIAVVVNRRGVWSIPAMAGSNPFEEGAR